MTRTTAQREDLAPGTIFLIQLILHRPRELAPEHLPVSCASSAAQSNTRLPAISDRLHRIDSIAATQKQQVSTRHSSLAKTKIPAPTTPDPHHPASSIWRGLRTTSHAKWSCDDLPDLHHHHRPALKCSIKLVSTFTTPTSVATPVRTEGIPTMLDILAFLIATPTTTLILAYAAAYLAIMTSNHNW